MSYKRLEIEGFAPNCLMGVTGAISKYYDYVKNINKLYFHSSYIYKKSEGDIFDAKKNCMNVEFSRELPIKKEEFMERLRRYYGLEYFYKEYNDFEEYVNDIDVINEPVMAEIDYYYMYKYRHYQKIHSQHMMIIEKVDKKNEQFFICEAVYGHFTMSFKEYKEYFNEVVNNRKRNIYLLKVKNIVKGLNTKVRKEWFLNDLKNTYENLSKNNLQGIGMKALLEFKKDFIQLLKDKKCKDDFEVPGMWVFMCDNMNNVNFINEFKQDYPEFNSCALEEIRKASIIINRKWFYITMGIKDLSKLKIENIENAFEDIEKSEHIIIENLPILIKDIEQV